MRRFAIGWAIVAAVLLTTAGPLYAGSSDDEGSAGSTNTVSDLSVEQKQDGTYLRLKSTSTPSFSVYKLTNPLRLVVDVSGSQLKADRHARDVNNGVVSKVALLETTEDDTSRVRLIVGFAESTHYDVRTDGKDLVIFVEGKPQPKTVAAVRRELKRKKRKLASLKAELERVRTSYESKLESAQAEAEEATKQLKAKTDRVESLRADVDRLNQKLDERRTNAGQARAELQQKLKQRKRDLRRAKDELDDQRNQVDELESTIASLKKQRRDVRGKLDEARAELRSEKKRVERQAKRLSKLEQQQKSWRQKLEQRTSEQKRAEQKVKATRQKLESARAEVRRLKSLQKDNSSEGNNRQLARKVESKKAEIQRLTTSLDNKKSTLADLKTEIASLKKDNRQTREKLASMQEKLASQRRTAQQRADKLESLRDQLQTAKRKSKRRADKLESTEQDLQKTRDRLQRVQRRLDSKNDRIATLESKVEQRESTGEQKAEKLAKLRRERDSMKQELRRAQSKLEQVRARLAKAKSNSDSRAAKTSGDRRARAEPIDASEPNTIRDIRLVQRDGESRIVVELERPGEYRRLPWRDHRAVMLLKNVELPERLQNTIAASGDSGAVRFVSSKVSQPGQVRMEANVEESAQESIKQRGSKLVWEFAPAVAPNNPARAKNRNGDGARDEAPRRPQKVQKTAAPPGYPRTVIDPSKVDYVPGMADTRMTLDIRNADIQNVLRMFAKQGDVNIITGDNVQGNVTITLEEVPLDRAFLIVLQSQGLGFEIRGSVIRVATQKILREERKARQEAAQRAQKLEPLEVFMMPINYAEASDLTDQVQRLLSPRGSVSVDERTNTLIIKDLRANIRSIRQLVNTLDTQVPQVLIKARIVETNDTFSREFGIQWGGDFTASQGNGNPTGLAFPNVIGVAGGATDSQTNASGTGSNPNFAVNLPAPAGTGTGGALGMTLGSIGGAVNLNLRLSAAEESGRAKIVSAPKILTLDNREATISQGTSIPISVVSAAGVQTVFVDATLELTVRPHVTPDGHIQLSLTATKNEPDFQNTGARGDPTIIRRSAETELLIEDGDTTVIGGIYTRNSGTSMTGIPFLHKIPILGALFKTTDRSERRSELLIFITPRIVNRADALGNVSAGDVVSPGSSGNGGGGGGGNAGSGNTSSGNAGGGSGGSEVRTRMEP